MLNSHIVENYDNDDKEEEEEEAIQRWSIYFTSKLNKVKPVSGFTILLVQYRLSDDIVMDKKLFWVIDLINIPTQS